MNLNYENDIEFMDDEYRFRSFLRENGISDRRARQAFKKDKSQEENL